MITLEQLKTTAGLTGFWTGKVIQALEIAIPTMQIGEIAEITCTYDYGQYLENQYL